MKSGIHSTVVSDSRNVKSFIPALAQLLGQDNRNNGTILDLRQKNNRPSIPGATPDGLAFFQQVGHLHGHVDVRGGVLALPPMILEPPVNEPILG